MGETRTIITVYLSNQASQAYGRYVTWQDSIDRALETIAVDPYPPGWEEVPYTTLTPDRYDGCIVVDYAPFQYVYQFDSPDEITVVIITLCFPHSVMM